MERHNPCWHHRKQAVKILKLYRRSHADAVWQSVHAACRHAVSSERAVNARTLESVDCVLCDAVSAVVVDSKRA
jgi:Ser/Thr protein kinase RdoA (MazF antagonist)